MSRRVDGGSALCLCGCGERPRAGSSWMPRHYSPGKAKRAGIKSEGDLRRDEQLEEPMRGECSWCGTG